MPTSPSQSRSVGHSSVQAPQVEISTKRSSNDTTPLLLKSAGHWQMSRTPSHPCHPHRPRCRTRRGGRCRCSRCRPTRNRPARRCCHSHLRCTPQESITPLPSQSNAGSYCWGKSQMPSPSQSTAGKRSNTRAIPASSPYRSSNRAPDTIVSPSTETESPKVLSSKEVMKNRRTSIQFPRLSRL